MKPHLQLPRKGLLLIKKVEKEDSFFKQLGKLFLESIGALSSILLAIAAMYTIFATQRTELKKSNMERESKAYEIISNENTTPSARAMAIVSLWDMYEKEELYSTELLINILATFLREKLKPHAYYTENEEYPELLDGDVDLALRRLIIISREYADKNKIRQSFVNMEGVWLVGIDLKKYATSTNGKKDIAFIDGWNLNHARLNKVILPDMRNCSLEKADLSDARLETVIFHQMDFHFANLSTSVIRNFYISDSNFEGALFPEPGGENPSVLNMDKKSWDRRKSAKNYKTAFSMISGPTECRFDNKENPFIR
jgi:uncharacterized protein YjbI with pentapeptide repeats